MDAKDFLTVAERYQASPREAERRTSIGRSYYALFNFVKTILEGSGVIFPGDASDHRKLVDYLIRAGHRVAASTGQELKGLRSERNSADYELRSLVPESSSQAVYARAISAISRFEAIPAQELTQIVGKIQKIP